MKLVPALFFFLLCLPLSSADYFAPTHRLTGVGVERAEMSEAVLASRTQRMIESQTFAILRDPRALAGAKHITSPVLERIFHEAAKKSGLPADLIAAVAYLESWGDSNAESPTGPKGIMQFSAATARNAGLKMAYAKRYRVTSEKTLVKHKKGKPVYRTVKHKTPYTVLVRDDRTSPAKAVPAAANYLARLVNKFGGEDWAVWAYHCGEGCVADFLSLAVSSNLAHQPPTVASVFFAGSPAHNRPLYEAVHRQMERDYSPTYWFRIMRARQLLALYKEDTVEFQKLYDQYRYEAHPEQRAPNRLSVWLRTQDLVFQTTDDLREERSKKLVHVLDDPKLFGFELRKTGAGAIAASDLQHQEYYLQASPSAVGTLVYIAFETQRLFEAMHPKGEKYLPLEVTGLVFPKTYPRWAKDDNSDHDEDFPEHGSGQVFDLSVGALSSEERECLDFILDEMGWDGYLGFVQESPAGSTLHVGCSPASREFFTQIYEEALAKH
jgi:hypothetical protein